MKKLMLGALAALCALLALPAFASATPAHISGTPEFTIEGGASALSRVAGGGTTGTSVTGSGFFENTTTGRMTLTFHHVTSPLGTNCQSEGQPAGTVKTTELTFHLVMLASGTPGINVTGGTTGTGLPKDHYVTFGCGIFIPSVVVKGNGVLGHITTPECGKSSTEATIDFNGTNGVQEFQSHTGTNYTLESSISGGAYSQSAMQAEATVKFASAQTLTCT